MADLIDRDALGIGKANPNVFEKPEYADGWNSAVKIVQDAPIVDAVEVVRCQDCIGRSLWHNDVLCGCAVCSLSGMYPESEDSFCSYGIQKDDDGNG